MDSHRLTFGSITQTPEMSTARLQSHCEEEDNSLALLDHTFGEESKQHNDLVVADSIEQQVQAKLYQSEQPASHLDLKIEQLVSTWHRFKACDSDLTQLSGELTQCIKDLS